MVFVQIWPFCQSFFFHLIQLTKMSFTIFQKEKNAFQAIKTRSLKSRKADNFPKRLSHGFGPNMAIFPTFFFKHIGQGNVFYDILDRKNAFLDCKNEKHKKSKNSHFSKRVNPWFSSKYGHFSNLFFRQYWLGKSLLRYSRTNKRPSRL